MGKLHTSIRLLITTLVGLSLLVALAVGVASQDEESVGSDTGAGQAISDRVMEVWATGDAADIDAIYDPDVTMMLDTDVLATDREEITDVIEGAIHLGNTYRQVGPVIEYVDAIGDMYVGSIVEVNGVAHRKGDPVIGFYRVHDGKVIRHIFLYGPQY
jgi:hypothetical protein